MASPDKSKRKILKAKKTMPTSCRKQIEILNKSKNTEALKTTAIGSNVPGNNVSSNNQNLSTSVITGKCIHSENVASSLDSNRNSVFLQSSEVFPQNLIKPLEEIVNSAAGMEYVYEEDACPHQKPSKVIDSPSKLFIQEAKYSGNTFENHSENHFEYQAAVTRSFFELEEALKSICSQPSVLSDVIQIPKSTVTNTLDDKRMDKMASHSETNFNAKSHDKRQNNNILSSDLNFVPVEKMPLLVNSVNSICAADVLKTDISSRTCHSSISNCESKDTKWQLSLDADNNHSHYQKKRIFSENKENVKRMKTTEQINENICVALERQTALLEQVRHLIRQEICSINYKLFDNKLKELKERIGKTQCMNKHEAIADELFAKIAKLQRRIKTVRLSQRNCLEPNMRSSNTTCEVVNSESMNLNKNPESFNSLVERITSVNYEPSSNKTSEKINLLLDCDDSVSESNNDDVMLISVESPNLTPPITSNPTDIRTITLGNSNNSPSAETEVMTVQKKRASIIDLTREGLSNCITGHYQKKRIFSENKENVKRMKTTEQINENICVALERQTALLEQVRHLIRQEICSINYKLFDNKLKELKERIGKTQCMNKHEAIADELFAKIGKLQRRIKTVMLSQRNYLEPNMRSSNTTCEGKVSFIDEPLTQGASYTPSQCAH
ncbi:activating transcription factor 7-interacting protein 2 isoform X2 [Nycticebus coucang]|uniref:activating transcription factor 7-interacting protein 2 isoform X2 n=1 Tax=Nycticebus coucang TaxID=9470 RepID=UPI00234CC0D3|nr:activating transcription factor 7-interacting protein 2 isoform X2 [Nycticebus coucang]